MIELHNFVVHYTLFLTADRKCGQVGEFHTRAKNAEEARRKARAWGWKKSEFGMSCPPEQVEMR